MKAVYLYVKEWTLVRVGKQGTYPLAILSLHIQKFLRLQVHSRTADFVFSISQYALFDGSNPILVSSTKFKHV